MKKNLPRPLKLTLLVLMVCCAVLALTYLEALYLSLSNKKTAFTDFYYKGLFNVYTVDQCWSMDCYPTFRPLLYANRFNFEKLNDTYAKDNFSAFCDREIVWESSYPEHHPTRLAAHTGSFTALSRNYAKDTKNVFFWCDKIPEVDAASFSVISEYLSHDKNQFFFKQTPTQVPYSEDTEIFSLRGGDNGYILYSADQLTCFSHKHIPESMYDNRLAKSEVTTQKVAGSSFEYLGEGYSKDTDHLYFGCTVLETADTSQVKYLGNNYLVLGDHVYYGGKLLKQANGKKFTLISEEEFKKRNITRHYADGKLDPIAPYVYQIVGYDGQFYFAFGETIEPVN